MTWGTTTTGKTTFPKASSSMPGITQTDKKYSALRRHLRRFGERVFCYELYHQLQCHLRPITDYDDGPILQGELKKDDIRAIKSVMSQDIGPLDKEYIPDFLYHSPANFDYQQVVIEIKTNPNVSFKALFSDLWKLGQFTTRYGYKMGILLVVNNDGKRIKKMLERNKDRLRAIASLEKIQLMVKRNKECSLWETPRNIGIAYFL